MSGSASVSNTFQSAVTATGLQLDQNYASLVSYANDPTNRNNYAADTGTTGTILVSFNPPIVGGYSAGLELTFKAATTNQGAVVINGQGIGNAQLVNQDGTQLTASQIVANGVYKAIHNGSNFNFIGGGILPQSNLLPSAKARFGGTTPNFTLGAGIFFGISGIVGTGTGTYSISFSQSYTSTAYPVFLTAESGVGNPLLHVASRQTSGMVITASNPNSAAVGPTAINVLVYQNDDG